MTIEEMIKLDVGNLSVTEMLKIFPYEAAIEEQVYDCLYGSLIPECRLSWVENIFVPGHACYEEYKKVGTAYERLCERLGVGEEDEDVEIIINALLEHGHILAVEMFRYGRMYERMQIQQK